MANFFRIGSAGLNWSNVGSWSATSGGGSNGSAQPSSSDNVTFDTNSPATVTVAGTASCNTLTLNKASLVITLNGGSLTASSTTTVTTAATINKTASETMTVNGLAVNGTLSGTAKLILASGTWTTGSVNLSNDLDLNGSSTISGVVRYTTGILTYVSGTITVTSSTLSIQGSCTLNTNGMTWNNISTGQTTTITLTSNISQSGLLTFGTVSTINKTVSETWTTSGGITVGVIGSSSGTAKIIITGGTWTGSSAPSIINNDLDLQGNITLSTNVYYGTNTLSYVSGTLTVTSSTLNLTASCTLSGGTYNNITCTNTTAQTYTINSLVTANGTLTLGTGAAVTFAGTAGFTVNTLTSAVTGAQTITLKNSVTYTITAALTCFTSRNGSSLLFTSDDGTLKATLTLTNGATCNCLANFTRIDASGGRPIRSFNGTITSCNNIVSISDLPTYGG